MAAKILVVEDEAIVGLSLVDSLKRLGYDPRGPAASGAQALQEADREKPDLVLMDIRIQGDVDVIDTAAKLVSKYNLPVIYLTAYTDDATLARAQVTEPHGYLVKPYDERELRSAIEIALYRHRSEQRLKEVERWLASTLRSIGDGVIAVDRESRVNYMNPVAEMLTECPVQEASGRLLCDVLPVTDPEGRPYSLAKKAMEEGVVVMLKGDHRLTTRSGKTFVIDDSAAPVRNDEGDLTGAVIIFRSAEDRLEIESRILSLQRLESIGRLTAGIAHDFNNLLTVIQGNLWAIKEGVGEQAMEDALAATEQAARITRQLLAFSHPRHHNLLPLELCRTLEEASRVLNSLMGERHQLKIDIRCERLFVAADRTMLEQVITNLVLNARDALADGGEVHLSIERVRKTPPPGSEDTMDWAAIKVEDHGEGIAPEHLTQIFEPFFTTKPAERGTGLGLSTCYGVVKSHGGWIDVESRLGQGSCFTVYLPISALGVTGKEDVDERPPPPRVVAGKGSILLVEDELALGRLVQCILQRAGFQVSLAPTADEALVIFEEIHENLDLLLTDLTLPGSMGGRELAARLKEISPELKVAFMSGYSQDLDDEAFARALFLPKPFTPLELVTFVNTALGS